MGTYELVKDIAAEVSAALLEGGPGSGNWGHKGRPGKRGGSAPGGGKRGDVSAHAVAKPSWVPAAALQKDAEATGKRYGVKASNLEYAGVQSFKPMENRYLHLWNIADRSAQAQSVDRYVRQVVHDLPADVSPHVLQTKRAYSREMALRVKKKGISNAAEAMAYLKRKYPGQPEDRYGRAIEKAGLKVAAGRELAVVKKAVQANPMLAGGVVKLEKTLQNNAVSDVKKLGGGVTETFVGNVQGDGKAVFKTLNNSAKQERAAYEISNALGFGIVPPVAFRKVDVGKGGEEQVSAMAFIPGKTAATFTGKFKSLDMAKITAFDFIIANQDRHPDNFVIDEKGKTWAIDNAFAFGTARKTTSATYPAVADKPIPGAVKAGVKRLVANRASLEPKLATLLGNPKKAKALFDRAAELSAMTQFPKDRFSFYSTWQKKHGGYTPEKIKGMTEGLGWLSRLFSTSTTSRRTRM